uniref:Uncharacterized protein n=1 Tax=Clastoptera arizonana TaxID=38151 RepID=A0A1B6D4B4_9HEMI
MKLFNENALVKDSAKSALMFLFNLAWESRIRLPFLIAVGFMVLDIRMQLEFNVNIAVQRIRLQNDVNNVIVVDNNDSDDDDSDDEDDDSWETEEEEDIDVDEIPYINNMG